MADTRYKKIEPVDKDAGLKLIAKAVESIPQQDNTSLEDKLSMLSEGLEKVVESNERNHRASKEAYESFLNKLVGSIENLAKVQSESSQEPVEPIDVQALLEGMAKLIPEPPQIIPPPPPVDVEGIVEKVFNLTSKKPTYQFQIERDHSGVLVGIKAIPTE